MGGVCWDMRVSYRGLYCKPLKLYTKVGSIVHEWRSFMKINRIIVLHWLTTNINLPDKRCALLQAYLRYQVIFIGFVDGFISELKLCAREIIRCWRKSLFLVHSETHPTLLLIVLPFRPVKLTQKEKIYHWRNLHQDGFYSSFGSTAWETSLSVSVTDCCWLLSWLMPLIRSSSRNSSNWCSVYPICVEFVFLMFFLFISGCGW